MKGLICSLFLIFFLVLGVSYAKGVTIDYEEEIKKSLVGMNELHDSVISSYLGLLDVCEEAHLLLENDEHIKQMDDLAISINEGIVRIQASKKRMGTYESVMKYVNLYSGREFRNDDEKYVYVLKFINYNIEMSKWLIKYLKEEIIKTKDMLYEINDR